MGAICGRFFGDAERTSPEMTTGWMPTYGSGKGDEPMMSGKLFKRSSLHGTFQPRHFELLLNKQTGLWMFLLRLISLLKAVVFQAK